MRREAGRTGESMWEANYGKEPFDLRLTVLYMLGRWKLIAACTLAGTLLFGGIYCIRSFLMNWEPQYSAKSVYRADYAVEDRDLDKAFINAYTWNTYVHTEEFLAGVRQRLKEAGLEALTGEELGDCIIGNLESDWRVPSTVVTAGVPENSVAIARAVEAVMTEEFPAGIKEIDAIRVIDPADEALEVIPDVRPVRAFLLAAALSLFFTTVALLLREMGACSIRLPSTIRYRYGLKALGTLESAELKENVRYLFAGMKKAAVCAVQDEIDIREAAERLEESCKGAAGDIPEFCPMPSVLLCPESASALREAEGILLVVKAGAYAGKQLEYVLEYLRQQDCEVTAVLLWQADERLLRRYYWFARRKQRAGKTGEEGVV